MGERATIRYARIGDTLVAEEIATPQATLVGKLDAMDPKADTVMVKGHEFHLGDDCAIVVGGKGNAPLSDLYVGGRVAIDYRNVDGVWVASRIAPATVTAPERAQNTTPQLVPYP